MSLSRRGFLGSILSAGVAAAARCYVPSALVPVAAPVLTRSADTDTSTFYVGEVLHVTLTGRDELSGTFRVVSIDACGNERDVTRILSGGAQ